MIINLKMDDKHIPLVVELNKVGTYVKLLMFFSKLLPEKKMFRFATIKIYRIGNLTK